MTQGPGRPKGSTSDKAKRVTLHVRVKEASKRIWQAAAKRSGMDLSEVVRMLLDEWAAGTSQD